MTQLQSVVNDVLKLKQIKDAVKNGHATIPECRAEYTAQITSGDAESLCSFLETIGELELATRVGELAQQY